MAYRLNDLNSKIQNSHEDGIWSVAWSRNTNLLITGSVDSTVKTW